MLFADVEANGLLDTATVIHCLTLYDSELDQYESYDRDKVEDGVKRLQEADCLVFHNGISFDMPCIKKIYPWFTCGKVLDTLVLSRLIYPDIKEIDLLNYQKWNMPSKLIGSHSLKAWGFRTGEYKGDFGETSDWQNWSEEMTQYCLQDTRVLVKLYEKLMSKEPSQEAVELEHSVAEIIQRQVSHGFLFDVKKAEKLYVTLLQKKGELEEKLQEVFPPFRDEEVFIPKVNNKARGYVKGVPFTKVIETPFNPGSRQHIARVFKEKYKWKPKEFTPAGQPKIDEDVLLTLPYPEAKVLAEYFMIQKRLGQLGDGDKGWLKLVKPDGRIHGEVITNGAVTGRMTHNNPNIAQVPACKAPYGYECRELFTVPKGYKLVGCDAAALELRCLAHFMYPWDKGEYARAAVEGKKEDGTDIHTLNMKALGITSRDAAKTWFYAYIYGAGNYKLGSILAPPGTPEGKLNSIGKQSRMKFEKNLSALGKLQEKVKKVAKERGYLIGLDGRRLRIRSEHSALNTLLQSAGAIVMKKALCILDEQLKESKINYSFVANIHDEYQIEVEEASADFVAKVAPEAIRKAGEYFKFRCPLDGEAQVASNWAETH